MTQSPASASDGQREAARWRRRCRGDGQGRRSRRGDRRGIESGSGAGGQSADAETHGSRESAGRSYRGRVSGACALSSRLRRRCRGYCIVGRICAVGKFEVADARAPVEASRGFQVFGGVPHGAIVRRIHTEVAVIAPAGKASVLRSCAVCNGQFTGESSQWISRGATGEPDSGVNAAAGNAVSDRHVAYVVHGGAAHPSETGVRSKRSLLENRGRGAGGPDLIPPDTHAGS